MATCKFSDYSVDLSTTLINFQCILKLNTRLGCSLYFMTSWLLPVLMGQTVSEGKVSEAKKQMVNALDTITNVWLKDKPFIVGNEITVADLVAATEIEQLGG